MRFLCLVYFVCFVCFLLAACQGNIPTTNEMAPSFAALVEITETAVIPTPTSTPLKALTPTPALLDTATSSAAPTKTVTMTPFPTSTATPIPTATPDSQLYGRMDALNPAGKKVIFWHGLEGFPQTILEEIIADFNEVNPNGITVQAENAGSQRDIEKKLLTNLERPDLVAAYADQTAVYQAQNLLIPLQPYLYHPVYGFKEDELAAFFPDTLTVYGVPLQRSMELLYVNEDWLSDLALPFSSLPTTPEQFALAACSASDAELKTIGYEIEPTATNMMAWIIAYGGDLYDEAEHRLRFDSSEAVAAMSLLQTLLQDGCATVADGFSYQEHFANRKLLFGPGSSRGLYFYGRAVANGTQPFNWLATSLPSTSDSPKQLVSGLDINLLQSDPDTQLAAWLFLTYFLSPDVQARWAQVNDNLPVRADTGPLLSDHFANHPAQAEAFHLMQFSLTAPPATGQFEIWREIVDGYGRILQNEDAETTLQQLNETINRILSESE